MPATTDSSLAGRAYGAGPAGDERRVRRLVAAAQTGDRDAMPALYLAFAPGLEAYVARIVGRHDAEDVTQQVFAKLMAELPRYRAGEAPFQAWLLRVARNLALDHPRRGRLLSCAHGPAPEAPSTRPR